MIESIKATEYVTQKNDIEKWEGRGLVETNKKLPAQPLNQQASFFEAIERLAANPAVDVEKIKQIMEMQEHVLDRNAEQSFNAAMVRAQARMPTVPKDRENTQTHSWYSSYEIVLKYTKPIYTGEGFSVLMYEGDAKREDEIRVYADIMHEQGHTKKRYVDIPIDDKGIKGTVNKTKTHAKGSSLSYGKGYLIKMIFNIPTGDDDDGNAAGGAARSNDISGLKTIPEVEKYWKKNKGSGNLGELTKLCAERKAEIIEEQKKSNTDDSIREPGEEG